MAIASVALVCGVADQLAVGFVMEAIGVRETQFNCHAFIRHLSVENAQQDITRQDVVSIEVEDGLRLCVGFGRLRIPASFESVALRKVDVVTERFDCSCEASIKRHLGVAEEGASEVQAHEFASIMISPVTDNCRAMGISPSSSRESGGSLGDYARPSRSSRTKPRPGGAPRRRGSPLLRKRSTRTTPVGRMLPTGRSSRTTALMR